MRMEVKRKECPLQVGGPVSNQSLKKDNTWQSSGVKSHPDDPPPPSPVSRKWPKGITGGKLLRQEGAWSGWDTL